VATPEVAAIGSEKEIGDADLLLALRDDGHAVANFRHILEAANASQAEKFGANVPIENIVRDRARTIDRVIRCCWQHFVGHLDTKIDLVAVGGYGRGELHPGSDIDLLVLLDKTVQRSPDSSISSFLTFLWDIGLDVGHSVRTLDDCESEAAKDVSVITTLMETRLLAGSGELYRALAPRIGPDRMWPPQEFYKAKLEEQQRRHHRYHDTAYNLEPNVKSSPGGLRDIQMIGWIARRLLNVESLEQLVEHGLLTQGQFRILLAGRSFLWRIRFALHQLTGRGEDRLLFDHQVKLAKVLGYEDASFTLAVEQLMQKYYRTVMELSRLNEMLLQLFEEQLLADEPNPPAQLSASFQVRNGYLEAIDVDIFNRDPSALLEIFLLLEQHLELKGVNARTIALIKQHLWLIDEEFRQNPRHQRIFLEILRAPHGVTRTLRRMNTYGVLGLYIPAFSRIVGRMQYDLFHAYTVDAHTLFVVENLRRMALPRFNDELPNASAVMQQLEKPEIVYLAGLFHDIAKGRGGDHSELGAVDAEAFCLEHGMSRYDARLVSWLVQQHLLLSLTAQKKDINDPNVITEFAKIVGDETHLNHLYVLTVADVRGTNPKIWNSWKDSLFWDLYQATKRTLRRGFSNLIDEDELIASRQGQARDLLEQSGLADVQRESVWSRFTSEYFLRHRPDEIAWHTRVLCDDSGDDAILVDAIESASRGLTEVMVYAPNKMHSFARTTAALDQLSLNVVDARILPLANNYNLDTYCVLDSDGMPVADARRLSDIKRHITNALTKNSASEITVTRQAPRQVRVFSTPVSVDFSRDASGERTVMEVIAGDRPGLLLAIGALLEREEIFLLSAKISTIGERAEDAFLISTSDDEPLNDAQCEHLGAALKKALST